MRQWRIAVAALAALTLCGVAAATGTNWWTADTSRELLAGKGLGVAVNTDGRLQWTPSWVKAASLEEPVLSAVALVGDDALLGTGFPARLYRLTGDRAERLAELPADQVTALLAAPDGAVYVAAVAPAAVFRWDGERLERLGETGQDGIWALAWFNGSLVAAGGRPATLFRLRKEGLSRWVELPDTHARSLAVDGDRLLVGTSGKGMVFTVRPDGSRALVADTPFTEIVALAVDGENMIWAAAVVGDPGKGLTSSSGKASGGSDEKSAKKASVSSSATDLKLPKVGQATATSEVFRITSEGATLSVHRFTKQIASALTADGDGILVGTGFEGEVWRFTGAGGARVGVLDAAQVTAFGPGGGVALTQGPAAVLRRSGTAAGTYRHDPLVLKRPARWGRYEVSGIQGTMKIRFRSGARKEPDETWSEWSDWSGAAEGVVAAPPGKALQWEVQLGRGASLERVAVAYREVNLPPVVKKVELLEPGAVILTSPPPTGQYVDVTHPDMNGIFTVLGDDAGSKPGAASRGGKRYWRVGYRTVRWKAEDPNGDALRFRLELEPKDAEPLTVRKNVDGTEMAVDTTAVPDGWYRFRLTASDEESNPGGARTTSAVSRWFVVDNSAPTIELVRKGNLWSVTAKDALSPVARAEWSRDGKGWHPLSPDDGLLDGREEHFHFPAAAGSHLVVIRVIDGQHNRAAAGAKED